MNRWVLALAMLVVVTMMVVLARSALSEPESSTEARLQFGVGQATDLRALAITSPDPIPRVQPGDWVEIVSTPRWLSNSDPNPTTAKSTVVGQAEVLWIDRQSVTVVAPTELAYRIVQHQAQTDLHLLLVTVSSSDR